ncbi:uncharacterized protein LOC115552673 isoform X2 [Gadus morhua]|uniref:uncharacterized protein LOC115552673 isoform X2 n=1 Tax=Gadus morhua TaxID=8049 RepID=UPI0011B557D2|nr:uncharacterized protein LOC115552673 isoform X2 [Gadus morhua]
MTMFLAMMILRTALLIQTQEDPQSLYLKEAKLGDTVTLDCTVLKDKNINEVLNWYKQSLGFNPQMVASRYYTSKIKPSFTLRVTVGEGSNFNLTITNVKKEDEANYFCNQGSYQKNLWKNGVFLTVKDQNYQRFVSQTVVQQPVSASAQLGDPVALQCSITSQRTDPSNQCQGEPSVYWFRSGPSHPAAIYMNGNRSGECLNSSGPPSAPQSCVYTLPKNNVDSSDAGTYYCALAACGEVVFGNGTKLEITEPYINPVTMVLGILLVCCLVGNIIQFVTRNKKQVCEHCKGNPSAFYHVSHASVIQEQQDGETDSLNYGVLEFSGRKTKGRQKNSERTQECLYSALRETGQEVHQPGPNIVFI